MPISQPKSKPSPPYIQPFSTYPRPYIKKPAEYYRQALLECFEWSAQKPHGSQQQMQDALVHIWNVTEAALKHQKFSKVKRDQPYDDPLKIINDPPASR